MILKTGNSGSSLIFVCAVFCFPSPSTINKGLYLHPELRSQQKTLRTAKCSVKAARLNGCAIEYELSLPSDLFSFLFPSTPIP